MKAHPQYGNHEPAHPCPMLQVPTWKRAMDLAISLSALVLLSPLLAVVAVLSRIFLGRGIVFRQLRGGHGGQSFELFKLRSMTNARSSEGILLPDHERSHWWGRVLRRTSIDELPGLLNVVRGEMSIVGPRPFLAVYLERYDEHQAQRHRLRPGLTGLAQVEGRNLLQWDERFELDNRYIDELSLREDLRLITATIRQVLSGRGADGVAHTTEFLGHRSS